jgi:uncharacterized membrane protein YfcA
MKLVLEMLSSNGKVSSIRFATLLSVLTVLSVYTGHNVLAIIRGTPYVDFPTNSVMLLLVMVGAKVGQHVSEAKKTDL